MVYDFEGVSDRDPPRVTTVPYAPHDLEAIVTLLELAAISLTPKTGSTFTFDELLAEGRAYAGTEFTLEEKDVRIVLPFLKFLKRESGARYSFR